MFTFKKQARRASRVTALAVLGSLALSGIAAADDIANTLDGTIDAVAEVMPLNLGGANGSTTLYVAPGNDDGKNGCNITGSKTLVLSLASSNTAVATVSPSSVTFGACGETKTLTLTPVGTGTATVTVSQSSNSTEGTFNLAPATFTVNVAPPANTAPQISVDGVTGGASYDKGSVPAATCKVTDAEDGNSSVAATLSPITGPHASDGIGSQTASCSYKDAGGLTASASETYSIVDPSAPVIGYTLNPAAADGSNGWYKGNATLTWSVSEPQSPNSLVETGCVDQNISADQAETTYTCSASSAGGSAAEQSVTIGRDGTAPVVAVNGVTGTTGNGTWYTSDVVVEFTATDVTSGLSTSMPSPQYVTSNAEGLAVTVQSPAFTDNAGNTAAAVTRTFNIDKTRPATPTFSAGISAGNSFHYGSVPAEPTCTSTDAVPGSGYDSCTVTGYSQQVGQQTLTATAVDHAGNSSTATLNYEVLAWTTKGFYAPVDMGDAVVNTVKGGSTVPLKFELFAGSNELTNADAVSFSAAKIGCTGTSEDAIEVVSSGGTSLRYDSTGGQFIQNWKTPTGAGTCYLATITADDGSTIKAKFKLK